MGYRIEGLDPELFERYRGRSDEQLASMNAERVIADEDFSYPCRVSLEDVRIGDSLILLNFEHQSAASPYQSRHAIFISESADKAAIIHNTLPLQLRYRLLSIRAFDVNGKILDADVVDGIGAEPLISRMLAASTTAYLHIHFAKRGCFAARVDRLD